MKNTKLVSCPNCGHSHRVRVRAEMGEGTQKGKSLKTLNRNLMHLMEVAIEAEEPMHVAQFSSKLFGEHASRYVRGDKDRPTGRWNAHNIQADLSLLVGSDMLCMSPGSVNRWDDTLGKYVARPIPKYFPDWLQRVRWDSVKDSADISNFNKRSARLRGGLSKEEHRELMNN